MASRIPSFHLNPLLSLRQGLRLGLHLCLGLSLGSLALPSAHAAATAAQLTQVAQAVHTSQPTLRNVPETLTLAEIQQVYAYQNLIHTFYNAFAAGDAETMVSCYHPDVTFEDSAFGQLKGEDAKDMWRMLIAQGGDGLKIKHKDVQVFRIAAHGPEQRYIGSAHWDAWYTFSLTGNDVFNRIDATFTFKDGLIYTHTDRFDFQRWSSMALGLPGIFLGGHPFFQQSFQKIARQRLETYQAEK